VVSVPFSSPPAFAIDSTSSLDLTDNDLIDLYGSAPTSPKAAIRTDIANAYDGGKWNLPGITDSVARYEYHFLGLGYADGKEKGTLINSPSEAGNCLPVMSRQVHFSRCFRSAGRTIVLVPMTHALDLSAFLLRQTVTAANGSIGECPFFFPQHGRARGLNHARAGAATKPDHAGGAAIRHGHLYHRHRRPTGVRPAPLDQQFQQRNQLRHNEIKQWGGWPLDQPRPCARRSQNELCRQDA
jgi:hypothetical protein